MITWLPEWWRGGTATIEPATLRDAPQLALLHGASFHRGWGEGEFEGMLTERNTLAHRLRIGRKLIGFAVSRIAADEAKLTTAFAKVAFAGDYGGTWFLTRLVGSSKAKELYYFSERLSAEDAQRLGIVNAIFPPADFEREVMERARRLAQGPSIAYRYMKENLNRAVSGELGDCMDLEVTHHVHTGLTEDHREAAQAFVEKREPRFRGR